MALSLNFFSWYYKDRLKGFFAVWKNFLWFGLNYFSAPFLLRTLFSPWRKYRFRYGNVFNVWENLETLVFNVMSRVIGAVIRIGAIAAGSLLELLIFFLGVILIALWILLPILIIILVVLGIGLLI